GTSPRLYRNPRYQYAFVQNAVDQDVRVICIGDNLDTADDNWEVSLGAAALRHGLYVPDTRRRVRRTATHAFHRGGMVQRVRYGYRKLTSEEAQSGQHGRGSPPRRAGGCPGWGGVPPSSPPLARASCAGSPTRPWPTGSTSRASCRAVTPNGAVGPASWCRICCGTRS